MAGGGLGWGGGRVQAGGRPRGPQVRRASSRWRGAGGGGPADPPAPTRAPRLAGTDEARSVETARDSVAMERVPRLAPESGRVEGRRAARRSEKQGHAIDQPEGPKRGPRLPPSEDWVVRPGSACPDRKGDAWMARLLGY